MSEPTARLTDWQLLRKLLTDECGRVEAAEKSPGSDLWWHGMLQGFRSALAYMDGLEQATTYSGGSSAVSEETPQ